MTDTPDRRNQILDAALHEFAEKGIWDMYYPPYHLPKRRYDIIINQIVVLLILVFVIYRCTSK